MNGEVMISRRKRFGLHEILRGVTSRQAHVSRRFSRRRVARDRAGRLVSAVTDGVATNRFAYDAFGAVTNETQNGVAVVRTYDGCGRLASMDGAAYGYDALGRLASVRSDGLSFTWLRVPGTDLPAGYVCGDFRRTVAWEPGRDLVAAVTNRVHVPQSPEVFAYDANGNQTVFETPTGRWTVEWNAENRPVRWTCGDKVLLMAYDHMGRRVRVVETVGGVTNRVMTFLYDGYLCIARTADGVTDRFLWDPTEPVATRPLATVADGTPYLYAHDANKNVSELVNALTGETAAHYDYSAFGRTLIAAGPLWNRNPFRFSSEYVDDATGLIYFNWRHYDPVHGRWLSEDPMEENPLNVDIPYEDSLEKITLYLICDNSPVNVSDVLGLVRSDKVNSASKWKQITSGYESHNWNCSEWPTLTDGSTGGRSGKYKAHFSKYTFAELGMSRSLITKFSNSMANLLGMTGTSSSCWCLTFGFSVLSRNMGKYREYKVVVEVKTLDEHPTCCATSENHITGKEGKKFTIGPYR